MEDGTRMFSVTETKEKSVKQILKWVYNELRKKGYNPINQIVGYLLSGDPTYVTNQNGARSLISSVERDELLKVVLKCYLDPE